MKVLGIDPGATSGWCVYDTKAMRVLDAGHFKADAFFDIPSKHFGCDAAVIERPVAHGPTRPEVVECAWVAGLLFRDMLHILGRDKIHALTRLQVKQELTDAVHGEIRVRNDATAWAALKLIHGRDCEKNYGALGLVRSHARAALAVAVAWHLRQMAEAQP